MRFKFLSKSDMPVALGLFALPWVFYWQVALGQKMFYVGDVINLFYPFRFDLAQKLASGQLPLWVPGLEAGFPLLAEGLVGALYPVNWILYGLLPTYLSFSYDILFHLSWGAVGMFLLLRSFNYGASSAILGSLIFAFGGFFHAHLQHLTLLMAAAWLPWMILFLNKHIQSRSRGDSRAKLWLILSSVTIAFQIFGGYPQTVIFNIAIFAIACIFIPLFRILSDNPSLALRHALFDRTLLQTWAAAAACIVLGFFMAAAQLIPQMELIGFSTRNQELGEAFFLSYSMDPMALSQFFFPFWLMRFPIIANLEYWVYIGIFPVLLLLLAPILRRDARTWMLFLVAAIAIALSLGESNPAYHWLYSVPVFNRFRVPARFLYVFTFVGSFLVAKSMQAIQNRLRDGDQDRWATVVVVALVIGLTLSRYMTSLDFWLDAWNILPWIFIVVSIVALSAAMWRLFSKTTFAVIVLGLTLLDLLAFWIPFSIELDQQTPSSELAQAPRVLTAMNESISPYRVFMDMPAPSWYRSAWAGLAPNHPLLYNKQSAQVYTGLPLQRNEEYVREMSPAMQNLMNIRYVTQPIDKPWVKDPNQKTLPGLDLFREPLQIPAAHATGIEIISYTEETNQLTDGTLAGELELSLNDGKTIALPIHIGIETADWAYEGLGARHSKPKTSLPFSAYLSAIGRPFEGLKYGARYDLPIGNPIQVTGVSARSFLSDGELIIERVNLIDEAGGKLSLAALSMRNDFSLVFKSHLVQMWENLNVLPRALLVHESQLVPNAQVLARLKEPTFRVDQVALLDEGKVLTPLSGIQPNAPKDLAEIVEYKPERILLRVETEREGYLLLTDSWYPGWVAHVDGNAAPILRANHIFRAVLIEAGKHQVEFEYRPVSFYIGVALSAVSFLLAIFWGIIARFRAPHPKRMQA